VPAAPHRHRQALLTPERHGHRDVVPAGAARHHRGPLVDHGVPHPPRLVVVGIAWAHDRPDELLAQAVDRGVEIGHGAAPIWSDYDAIQMIG
jgi:hypothetical protein